MQVELNRLNKAFHFSAKGVSDVQVNIDGAPDIGGNNAGARPMELILMGLGGCSAIDVLLILKKQRQEVEDIKLVIDGEREPGAVPAPFKKIHVKYILKGKLETSKVQRAIELSMEKYCSVTAMLDKVCDITHSFDIQE